LKIQKEEWVAIFIFLLSLILLVARLCIIIKYADTPLAELPAWVHWMMSNR